MVAGDGGELWVCCRVEILFPDDRVVPSLHLGHKPGLAQNYGNTHLPCLILRSGPNLNKYHK